MGFDYENICSGKGYFESQISQREREDAKYILVFNLLRLSDRTIKNVMMSFETALFQDAKYKESWTVCQVKSAFLLIM